MSSTAETTDAQDKPNPARIYDYLLGGNHNFAADRAAADYMITINPDAPAAARANRAFLRRAVTWCCNQGITQFLDIGSGIPTVGNVHSVARRLQPSSKVVYVDLDPVAVQYSQRILQDDTQAIALQADIRQPETIIQHPDVQQMLDFKQPVALLLLTVLHFIADDEQARQAVQTVRAALAPGSYVVISHLSKDNAPADAVAQLEALYARSSSPLLMRTQAQVERFFDGFTLVNPGLVSLPHWNPESENDIFFDQPERSMLLAGIGELL